jgi:bacterioferritin (cytochrome b1)
MHIHNHEEETHRAVDLLRELVQLEYDTMAAYRAAIDRVASIDARAELALFFDDHEDTARALASCIHRYGGAAKPDTDLEQAWTRGRVAIAELAGDHALLGALAHLENNIHTAYERAQSDLRALADPPLASAFESALAAEELHREWLLRAS